MILYNKFRSHLGSSLISKIISFAVVAAVLSRPTRVPTPPTHFSGHRFSAAPTQRKQFHRRGGCAVMALHVAGQCIISEASGSKYILKHELGRGAFGSVWCCRESVSRALRAVKILSCDDQDSLESETRLARLATEHVGESHVPAFYEASRARVEEQRPRRDPMPVFIIVTEFIDGVCLGHLLKCHRDGLTEDIVRVAMADVANALSRLPQVGIWHRDVKSDNILLSKDGHCYLCDFGVSTDIASFETCGTPLFMAPEMYTGQAYNEKVDIWCLGITALQLGTGTTPVNEDVGAGAPLIRIAGCVKGVSAVSELFRESFRRELVEVLNVCLERDPALRASAADLVALKELKISGQQRRSVQAWLHAQASPQ